MYLNIIGFWSNWLQIFSWKIKIKNVVKFLIDFQKIASELIFLLLSSSLAFSVLRSAFSMWPSERSRARECLSLFSGLFSWINFGSLCISESGFSSFDSCRPSSQFKARSEVRSIFSLLWPFELKQKIIVFDTF